MSLETQTAILKMADFVAKNGVDFENIVRARDIHFRFGFLDQSHRWHAYYAGARTAAIQVGPRRAS